MLEEKSRGPLLLLTFFGVFAYSVILSTTTGHVQVPKAIAPSENSHRRALKATAYTTRASVPRPSRHQLEKLRRLTREAAARPQSSASRLESGDRQGLGVKPVKQMVKNTSFLRKVSSYPQASESALDMPLPALAQTSGVDLSCDSVDQVYSVWLSCSTTTENGNESRLCQQCEQDEYWTGRWCPVDGDKLDCSRCPGVLENYLQHHFNRQCEKPNKTDCAEERHKCHEGCSVTEDSYTCDCLHGRRLNEDMRSCYDAIEAEVEVKILLSRHFLPFLPRKKNLTKEVLQAIVANHTSLKSFPGMTEITVQDSQLRGDELTATFAITLNKTADYYVASKAVNAILSVVLPNLETEAEGQEMLKINGMKVSNDTDKCKVLASLEKCSNGSTCGVRNGNAVCLRWRLRRIAVRPRHHSFVALTLVLLIIALSLVTLSVRLVMANITETTGTDDEEESYDGFDFERVGRTALALASAPPRGSSHGSSQPGSSLVKEWNSKPAIAITDSQD